MPDINPSLPIVGQPDSTEEPKVLSALQALVAAVNGNIDSANITDASIAAADLADGAVSSRKFKPSFAVGSGGAIGSLGTGGYTGLGPNLGFTVSVTSKLLVVAWASGDCTVGNPGGSATFDIKLDLDGVTNAGTSPKVGVTHLVTASITTGATAVLATSIDLSVGAHTVALEGKAYGSGGGSPVVNITGSGALALLVAV